MTNRIPTALALSPLLLLAAPAQQALAVCAPRVSLTGTWIGNDQGRYYIHQVGNTVWWVGLDSNTNGAGWTHAFRGFRSGDMVNGSWSDVRGPMGTGTLTLRQRAGNYLVRTANTGSGFGGSRWYRAGCPPI